MVARSSPTSSRCAPKGDGALAQLFDLIYIGDFVSLHLAAHEGVDPGPVPTLVEIKERSPAR